MKPSKPVQIIRLLLAAIVLPLCLCSCGSGGRYAGKYVDESNPRHYLELKSDGMFFLAPSNDEFTGKYEVSGDQTTITAGAFASRGTIQDEKIRGIGIVRVFVKK